MTYFTAGALLAFATLGVLGLRGLPVRVRIGFDLVWFLVISLYFYARHALPVFPSLGEPADTVAIVMRVVAAAWCLLGARIAVAALRWVGYRDGRSREARLFLDFSAGAIYVAAAALIVGSVFAMPINGLLATSGVAAILLGLALQNTLADVFAGIAVGVEAPFSVGDRIQVGDKLEGLVVQVNWRATRIQTDNDDVAIIPNSIIAKAEIVNRSLPSPRRVASVELYCPSSASPERVVETLRQATLLCPDILRAPEPRVVLTQLGLRRHAFKITFSVVDTSKLTATKDLLLRSSRQQLYHSGMLGRGADEGDISSPFRLMRDIIVFECLADHQIEGLAAALVPHRLEPGDVLFAEGDADPSIYIVADGVLECVRGGENWPEPIGCLGAGEYLGEIGLLTGEPHAVTVRALMHCHVFQLSRDAVTPLLTENGELAAALDKSARKGLAALNRRVAALATPHVDGATPLIQRIRNYLRFSAADNTG